MCKIMIIPGVQPDKAAKAAKLAKAARPYLTKEDRDAFGYAALTRDGQIFGERWTEVHEAFRDWTKDKAAFKKLTSILGREAVRMIAPSGQYNSFGTKSDDVCTWLLHARTATCGGGVENAHPFIRDGHALIHNGMIHNSHALKNLTSTCDSETILNAYVDADVANDGTKINNVATVLRGWYAVAVLAPTPSGYVVDVFRDGMANLICGYVPDLDTVVFCTKAEILRSACNAAGLKVVHVQEVPKECMYRVDAVTGAGIEIFEFEAFRYSYGKGVNIITGSGASDEEDRLDAWLEKHYGGAGEYAAPETTTSGTSIDTVVSETVNRADSFNTSGDRYVRGASADWDRSVTDLVERRREEYRGRGRGRRNRKGRLG